MVYGFVHVNVTHLQCVTLCCSMLLCVTLCVTLCYSVLLCVCVCVQERIQNLEANVVTILEHISQVTSGQTISSHGF